MTGSPRRSAGPVILPPAVRDADLSGLADGPLAADLVGYLAFRSIERPRLPRISLRAFDHWLAAAAASGATVISILMISAPVAR